MTGKSNKTSNPHETFVTLRLELCQEPPVSAGKKFCKETEGFFKLQNLASIQILFFLEICKPTKSKPAKVTWICGVVSILLGHLPHPATAENLYIGEQSAAVLHGIITENSW